MILKGQLAMSVVYLLHFSQPYRTRAAHGATLYGFTDDLQQRIAAHTGRALARACAKWRKERGISFVVAQLWKVTERWRKLKNRHAGRLCPICNRVHDDSA